jgi:tetratricopeptide (TPR) repeat protein
MRDGPRATDLLTRAVASDANFALAHAALSSTWRVQGYERRAVEEAKRALDMSAPLSQEGRLAVEAQYHEVSLNWPRAIESYRTLWASYPDNAEYGLKLGTVLQLANRFNDALPVVEQLRKMPAPDSQDPRIDLLEATIAERRADYPRAQKTAAAAADKARGAQAMLQLASTRVKQAIYAFRVGQAAEARTFVDEARQTFESFGDIGNLADARRWSGSLFMGRGQLDDAEREFATALQLSRRVNFARLTMEILSSQADLWRQRGRLAEARTAVDGALQIAREREDRSGIARNLVTLGIVLKLQGDFAEARRAYQEAIEVFQSTGEASNLSMAVNNIATIDLAQGHLGDARRALERQLPADRRMGMQPAIATRLANLSRVLGLQGELAAARTLNAEECQIHETLAAKANLAACRVRLAELWMADGHQAEARAAVGNLTTADLKTGALAPIDMAKLASVHLAAGDLTKAEAAIVGADRALIGRTIPEQAIPVAIARARVQAALGHGPAAAKILAQARADAERGGLLPLVLEARVAAAQQAGLGMNRAEATVLERDATKAGFGVIAGKARAIAREGLLTDAHRR